MIESEGEVMRRDRAGREREKGKRKDMENKRSRQEEISRCTHSLCHTYKPHTHTISDNNNDKLIKIEMQK